MDKKRNYANMSEEQISRLLRKVADFQEFAGEEAPAGKELSEDELEFVSAAGSVPSYASFLEKLNKK